MSETVISNVVYAYVEPGGEPPRMRVRNVDEGIARYLADHVDALLKRADDETLAPAGFSVAEGRERFAALAAGPLATAQTAAQHLASELFRRMDGRTKRGFFVTLRAVPKGTTISVGVALKLDVNASAGAALRAEPGGDATLEAVRDLLDIPGELQKGCIAPDGRQGSDAVVGDRLTRTSDYFLEALGLVQNEAPGRATGQLIGFVEEVAPDKAQAVAAALDEEVERISVPDFLDRHPDLLDDDEREQVLDRAHSQRRPIADVDPQRYRLMETIEADGITVRGPIQKMAAQASITSRPHGFTIRIDVSERPRRRVS